MVALRNVRRLSQVVNVLFKHGFGYVIHELDLKWHLPLAKRALFHKFAPQDTLPVNVRKVFEELGGAYVKLGQLLSLRPDLVPEEYCIEFRKLQDDMPAMPLSEVKSIIRGELGKVPFKDISQKPIGSASIAQVHEVVLPSGKKGVVKVQRPRVQDMLFADMDVMQYLAERIERRYGGNFVDIVHEFERYTKQELDFSLEGKNIDRFFNAFKKNRGVVIPRVYWDVSSRKVLTMDVVRGQKLSDAKWRSQAQKNRVAKHVLALAAAQIFDIDFFHADLHPGNIMVLPDDRIGLIDFGIVGHFDKETKKRGISFLSYLIKEDVEGTISALSRIGRPTVNTDMACFKEDARGIIQEWQGGGNKYNTFTRTAYKLVLLLVKHHMRAPPETLLFAKMLMTVEGTCLFLNPKFDIIKEVSPHMQKYVKTASMPHWENVVSRVRGVQEFLEEMTDRSLEIERKLGEGTLQVNVDDVEIKGLKHGIERSSNRVAFALIIASFVVASALLMNFGPEWYGVSVFSGTFLLVGFVLSVPLLVSMYKEGNTRV